jgi:hypothetical protein
MAAPNLLTSSSVVGSVSGQAITISATAIVSNSSGSNKLYKINSLYIANVNGTASADVTVDVFKGGTTAYRLAYLITVPAKSTINVIAKDITVYLEEGDSLRLTSTVNSYLEGICSYEVISA